MSTLTKTYSCVGDFLTSFINIVMKDYSLIFNILIVVDEKSIPRFEDNAGDSVNSINGSLLSN